MSHVAFFGASLKMLQIQERVCSSFSFALVFRISTTHDPTLNRTIAAAQFTRRER